MQAKTQAKKVVISAGGTGGHVFPGLAVAKFLRDQNIDVHWLGTSEGLEARLVPEANIPLHLITIRGIRGKGIRTLLSAVPILIKAIRDAYRILREIKPDVTIGLGGFVSGPVGIASWLAGYPLIIHEQNAKAGFTNKMLSYLSKRVLEGFPGAFRPSSKMIHVGNPIRSEIIDLPPPSSRFSPSRDAFRLLILGGSLGAQALNEILPRALAKLSVEERPEIYHQTGDKHFNSTINLYRSMGVDANLQPFIRDMAQAYGWADMVICRSGALTVAELCAAGLGAIFVPFPHAVDDHQTANAHWMVKNNAALCIQQTELTDERLAAIVREFAKTPEKRFNMAQAAYQLRKDRVTEKIYQICQEIWH